MKQTSGRALVWRRGLRRIQQINAVINWGCVKTYLEVAFNVLANNPALMLYEKMGFTAFELNLRKNL